MNVWKLTHLPLYSIQRLIDTEIRTLFPRFVFRSHFAANATEEEGLSRRFIKRGTSRLHFPRETVFSFHFQTYFHPGWKEPGVEVYHSKTVPSKLVGAHRDCGLTLPSFVLRCGNQSQQLLRINLASHPKHTRSYLRSHRSSLGFILFPRGKEITLKISWN